MSLLTLVFRNLLQRPIRSGLTTTGIAIGVAAVVALTSIAWGFEASWVRLYQARGTDLIVARTGSLSPAPPVFDQERTRDVLKLPHVARASAVMSEIMGIERVPLMLVFGWESHTFVWDHTRLVSGRRPRDDEREVMLGVVAADALHKTVGSSVQIETTLYTVCGIFDSASLTESGAAVMALPQLQRLTEQPGKVNFLNVKLAAGTTAADVAGLRRTVAAGWPGFKAYTTDEVAQTNTAIEAVKAMSWAVAAIALVIGAVGVMNTVLMSVFERMQEIGILLAVGWRRRRILLMILYESILLSIAGGLAGMLLGTLLVELLEATPVLRGKIQGDFSALLFGVALLISLALGLVGGLYPAYRGSRMLPAQALRHE